MNLPNPSESTPDPKRNKLALRTILKNITITAGAIAAMALVLERKIVIGSLDTLVQWLKAVNQLDIGQSSIRDLGGVPSKSSQLDLLSSLSINRVSHNFEVKSVTSALIFSESTKNQLRKFPVKTIDLKIEFEVGQDSVIFWILDKQRNPIETKLLKKNGAANSINQNERSFEIALGSLPRLDSDSISEIRIESRGLKSSSGSFAVKSLVMK